MRRRRLDARAVGVLGVLGVLGCDDGLAPGALGTARYMANVDGATPLALAPPISDRAGNAYVLWGDPAETEARVWVGHAGGGWTSSCRVSQGTGFGVHGWVGRSLERAFYWSGGALVRVSGSNGACKQVLERDPSSGAALDFVAVAPWVEDTPSATRALAWIQSPSDARPFQVEVDLQAGVYQAIDGVGDEGTDRYEVLGVGADPEAARALVVYRYHRGEEIGHRARFIGAGATTDGEVRVDAADELPPYGIVGYLQPVAVDRFVGLAVDGRLLLVDGQGGRFLPITGLTPVGIHRWQDATYVVGLANDRPAVAVIDATGKQGRVRPWSASSTFAKAIGRGLRARDDRALPSRDVTWKDARSAVGNFPFLSPHSLDAYAADTTLWLVAGPDYEAGGQIRTAVALVPTGVSYP